MSNPMQPDRKMFAQDPGGYSRSAWMRWATIAAIHGEDVDPYTPPTSKDLKNPILWLSQAEAMSQAAILLIRNEPTFENMPVPIRGICDSQYCAVSRMLVGYSLEIYLKAMIILRKGVDGYSEAERDYKHHDLKKLADFIPDTSNKELAILDLLTHFVYWAGRYPDPGRKEIGKHETILDLAEENQVSTQDLFALVKKIMKTVRTMVN